MSVIVAPEIATLDPPTAKVSVDVPVRFTVILPVPAVISSLKFRTIFAFLETPVALSAGVLVLPTSVGADLSNVTLPLPLVIFVPLLSARSLKTIV